MPKGRSEIQRRKTFAQLIAAIEHSLPGPLDTSLWIVLTDVPSLDRIRARDDVITRHRLTGAWRIDNFLTDLYAWRHRTPDAPAIIAHRSGGERVRLSYREYAEWVDRFAAALVRLGVGPGSVIAIQLPGWWQTSALLMAAMRVGAVIVPLVPTLEARESEMILRRLGASVCVTPNEWNGTDYAARIAEMAPRLPLLRHRVVLGKTHRLQETSFTEHFVDQDWRLAYAATVADIDVDPNRGALVLFTSGTTGEPKGAVHSLNTLYALSAEFLRVWGRGPSDRFFTPHQALHLAGIVCAAIYPLLTGGCSVMIDDWAPGTAPALLADEKITYLGAAPFYLTALMAAMRDQGRAIPSVSMVSTFGTTVPPQLVAEVGQTFGLALGTAWGMTEAGYIFTRPDDPADWAARSIGRPNAGTEIALRATEPVTEGRPGRLMIRGAGVCLATLGRDGGEIIRTDDEWYDTGDLAVPDGRGGIRLMGRVADRIGGVLMVPAADVEAALRDHPAVSDVALVGVPGTDGMEQVCAVVVPSGDAPRLDELRDFLAGMDMTKWYLPTLLAIRAELPYNTSGKVNKVLLRASITAP